jgi:4-hydroxybenzoate polyprenyltransferase
MGLLAAAFVVMAAVFVISPLDFGWFSYVIFGAGSFFLLLVPAQKLWKTGSNHAAMTLFNKASYYPFFLLCMVLTALFL